MRLVVSLEFRLAARGACVLGLCGAALALTACGQDGKSTTAASSGTTSTSSGGGAGGAGGTGGAAPDPMPLKVLNWNTRNFYNHLNDDPAPEEVQKTEAQYNAQRVAVGKVLKDLDPDVVVLQEVESEVVLDDLNETELAGAYTDRVILTGNDPRGIDIAILSKIPLDQAVTHAEDVFELVGNNQKEFQFSRDCPEYHLTFNGRKIVLLGVHLRSKGPPDDVDRRLAQAQRTRAIASGLVAEDPSRGIIVLGDFNDLPGSPPVTYVLGAEPDLYVNAPDALPSADRWTFDYMGMLELVDHQMANPLIGAMLDPASVTIPHGADIEDASDHSPVLATYLVR